MPKHHIKALRTAQGWSQEALGEKLGMTKYQVSRLEKGHTELTVAVARKIAKILGTSVVTVIGDDAENDSSPDLSDDISEYPLLPADPLAGLRRDNIHLFKVDTDVLDKAGISRGMVIEIDGSKSACVKARPLQPVRILYQPASNLKAVSLLRLFVPPHLLITNASRGNLPSIDMDEGDARITGVVVGLHHRFT